MKLKVKLDILDSDGNAEYDYEENYCMEVKDAPDDIAGEFRQRVKKAVIEVAKTDVEMARYIVENLGYADSHKEDHFDSFEEYFDYCGGEKNRDYFPFMLDGKPLAKRPAGAVGKPFSLIFGNEAAGLPESFKNVGNPVRIMHSGNVDSLNLPVAAAIGIYTFAGGKY